MRVKDKEIKVPRRAYEYILDFVIKGKLKLPFERERYVKYVSEPCSGVVVRTTTDIIKFSLNKLEKIIAKDAQYSYLYAKNILQDRFEEGEKAIAKSAKYSCYYASDVLKGRFERGEKVIAADAKYSYLYAVHALKGRFRSGENTIATSDKYSYYYAKNVLNKQCEGCVKE